ncbi:tyrosine-protein kinase Fer isoform X7 [Strix aluco]|uniref:tyrosine-protein kinase Fer isoform X7 n=1 Tax=Strix aluco TaxID=111821 RepID=UPI003DA5FBFB
MGFGGDLKYSHDALLKLQDWELRLLETVKKFMVMRVKSDKEYASTLQNLCNQVDKESACQLDYISNVSKSWLLVVQQTEQLSKIMKTHAEDLNSGPLHRLTMMIKDKQQVKKSYVGVHQQIEAEMYKVTKTELEKLKSSYRQLIKEVNSAKEKYKEAVAKVVRLTDCIQLLAYNALLTSVMLSNKVKRVWHVDVAAGKHIKTKFMPNAKDIG